MTQERYSWLLPKAANNQENKDGFQAVEMRYIYRLGWRFDH